MEGGAVESHLEAWSSQVTSFFPDRKVPTVVATSNGKTACITRFFRPIPPPGKNYFHQTLFTKFTLKKLREICPIFRFKRKSWTVSVRDGVPICFPHPSHKSQRLSNSRG